MKLFVLSALLLGAVTHVHAAAKGSAAPSETAVMKKLEALETKMAELQDAVLRAIRQTKEKILESENRIMEMLQSTHGVVTRMSVEK